MGSTGVGKSSTIKLLFNINQREDEDSGNKKDDDEDYNDEADCVMIGTSESESETRAITEYLLTSTDNYYEASDIKLGITDSPGSDDTAGQSQDACNMYAIKKFYETHPSFKGRKVYPNLVFLMIAASDERFAGCSSNLVKAMKSLGKLDLVDSEKPNLVGVITKASHLDRNKEDWIKSFNEKKKKFQDIIYKTFNFGADVVAIENFPARFNLKKKGYGFLLPDEETMQPKNMFDACTKLLRNNGDKFGYIAFTSAFKQKRLSPVYGHSVKAKKAESESLSDEEKDFLNFWQAVALGNSFQEPLITKAEKFCKRKNLVTNRKEKIINAANQLKRFYNKLELKGFSTNLVAQKAGIELDVETTEFLEELGVKKAEVVNSDSSVLSLGCGFNLITNKTTTQRILEYKLRDAKHGVWVPEPASFQLVNETEKLMCKFESAEDFVKSRLRRWGISFSVDANNKLLLESTSNEDTSKGVYWFVIEHRIFKTFLPDLSKIALTDHFKNDVDHLPKSFKDNTARFERFFNKWGHFFISEAYGGGSLEFKKQSTNHVPETETEQEVFSGMCNFLNQLISIVENRQDLDMEYEQNLSELFPESLNLSKFEFSGGDSSLHNKNTVCDLKKLKKWVWSLCEKPTMLRTEMNLTPISDLVDRVDREKGDACHEALENILWGLPRPRATAEEEKEQKVTEAATRDEEVANSRKNDDSTKSCFPGDALVVRLSTGMEENVPMHKLKIGDLVKAFSVQTNKILFSPVLLFAHYEPKRYTKFREIHLTDGNQLTISENHLIFSKKEMESQLAANLLPGDVLFLGSEQRSNGVIICKIYDVIKEGYFCPITEEGTIIVNNIRCSCYASCKSFLGIDAHRFAHSWLFPIRVNTANDKKPPRRNRETDGIPNMHPYIQILEKISRTLPFRF